MYGVMNTSVALLDKPTQTSTRSTRTPEPLLREALGLTLRAFRADKGVTLRELAGVARVPGISFGVGARPQGGFL